MTLQGNFTNLHRILRSPGGPGQEEGGGGAADDGMGGALELLNKRGAGIELEEPSAAEKAAAEAKAKKEKKVEEWSDDEGEELEAGEGEKTPEEIAATKKISDAAEKARKDKADADKRAKAAADGQELPSVEEIATETAAWKEKIAELEKKIEDADPDDKAGLAKELTEAQEALVSWESAAGLANGEEDPNVQTVEQVKAELTKAQAEKGQLEARVRELEAKGEPGLSVENVHPLFLADKPEQIEAVDAEYANFERWAMEHFDGVEEETDAKGKVTQRAYTKEQVRARYAEISQLRKDLIPRAREAVQLRLQGEAKARQLYPELFDPKRPESKTVQNILQAAPVLRVIFPGGSIFAIIRDAMEGERLRLGREAAAGKKNGAAASGARRPLPRVARPGAGSGVGAGAASGLKRAAKASQVKANGGIDPEKFMEAGGDRKALIASIS